MSEKIDGAQAMADISGIPRAEVLSLWEQVKANSARLESCPRHRFQEELVSLGQKLTCIHCGGTIGLTDAGWYIRGYETAGGAAEDIWPAFRKPKEPR